MSDEGSKLDQWVDDGYQILTIRKATRFEMAGRYFVAILRRHDGDTKTMIYLRAVPMGYEGYLNKKYMA